jgi:hypothetical protein
MNRSGDLQLQLGSTAIFSRRGLALRPRPAPAAILPARALFILIVIASAFDIDIFPFRSWVWLHGSFHLSLRPITALL